MIPDGTPFPKAVLFDMDGTLTAPTFDFPAIRRALGLPEDAAILEHIAMMPPERRLRAEEILRQFEDEVATTAPLADRCHEVLSYLSARGSRVALVTRNRRESVETFLRRHPLPIKVRISREDGPHKPDPYPLLLACRQLGVTPAECWMVGDGQFGIEAGINAGMRSIWLSWDRERQFAAQPWRTVRDLAELHDLMASCDRDGRA
jgi:HAD superfamily hydrolase (TIGR01509 family)